MKQLRDIVALLEASIKEDGATTIQSWDIIRSWYDTEVDAYRETIQDSHDWLSKYQAKIISQTGISRLKIKFTNASGYYIEVSKKSAWLLPEEFIHKQTLVNATRFITPELEDFQSKLFEAEGTLAQKEYEIFQDIRSQVLSGFSAIKNTAQKVAFLDMISGFSSVAYSQNYTRPEVWWKYKVSIMWGRHPVIESIQRDFVKNDLELDSRNTLQVITWPNMWWKSTFLRQNALILLMSHLWSFVPADSAKIPIVDKIFSRVWAHDNLFLWKSTFMMEMQEVSYILNNATDTSFIIIDEVGRGTSTYDGMSLAWGILKYIHDRLGAKTLFATHYHEIIDQSASLSKVTNHSVAVGENEENLVFLRKVVPWGIKKSYWLEVAKIAGLPGDVLFEAKKTLSDHQKPSFSPNQLSFDEPQKENNEQYLELIKYIDHIDIEHLTPLESLNEIAKIKKFTRK